MADELPPVGVGVISPPPLMSDVAVHPLVRLLPVLSQALLAVRPR